MRTFRLRSLCRAMCKPFLLTAFVLCTVGLIIGTTDRQISRALPLHLQSEPTAVIDAVLQDLSQRLGKTYTRGTVDNWTWEQDVFPDAGLGCPQPGQTYATGQVHGYKILVTINSIVYDYRARADTSVFFLCSPAASSIQPASVNPTAVPPVTVTPPLPTSVLLPTSALPITATSSGPSLLPASSGTPGSGQSEIAYINPAGNVAVLLSGDRSLPVTTDATIQPTLQNMIADPTFHAARSYGYLRWSPDGSKLMFVEFSTRTIYIAASGQLSAPVVSDYGLGRDAAFPPTWSPDGTQIAYVAHQPDGPTDAGQLLTLAVGSGQPPTVITNLSCGGTGSPAALDEAAYLRDLNRETNRTPAFLAWVGADILYGGACPDLTAIDSQRKTIHWTAHGLTHIALSPDGKHAVALTRATPPQMVLIDVNNGNVGALPGVPVNVDQIAWLGDNQTLVFSTFSPGISLAADPNSAVGKQYFGNAWPITARSRTVNLWSMPMTGGTPTQIYQSEGYQIGTLTPLLSDNSLVFTLITSLKPLVQMINAAQTAATVPNLDRVGPSAQLLLLSSPLTPHNISSAPLISVGGQPAATSGIFVPPAISGDGATSTATATVIPLVQAGATSTLTVSISASSGGQCPGAPPSRLIVGGSGRVTPGDPNILRDQAGSSRSLGIIPAGATFSVLAGPLCASNGVAWWQVQYNGLTGWTAEGAGSIYYLAPQ